MNRPGTPRTSGISGTTIIQHWHLWAACLCDTSSEPSILFRTISATPRRDLKHISTGNRKLTATTPRTSRTTRMSINNYHLQQYEGQRICCFRHRVGVAKMEREFRKAEILSERSGLCLRRNPGDPCFLATPDMQFAYE